MKIKDFYSIIHSLKFTKRQGWLGRDLEADSIASHVYGAVVLGLWLAEAEGVDKNKVAKMLLLHDLVMAKIEDVSPSIGKFANRRKYSQKQKLENATKKLVADTLPMQLKKDYLELFDEFQVQKTPEAQVAREADKLETLLQGEAYEEETGESGILDEFLETYKNVFKTKTGKKLYQQIKSRHLKRKKV